MMTSAQRRARWETQFANWSLQPPDQRPPDYDQFAAAFCFENPYVRSCDSSPPGLEETLEVAGLVFSAASGAWLARLGGEVALGRIAAIEGSVAAGGAVAASASGGAIGELGGSIIAAKIAAEAVSESGSVWNDLKATQPNYPGSQLPKCGSMAMGMVTAGSGKLLDKGLRELQEAAKISRKAVNLPAWKKVGIDMTHILSGHVEGARESVRSRISSLQT